MTGWQMLRTPHTWPNLLHLEHMFGLNILVPTKKKKNFLLKSFVQLTLRDIVLNSILSFEGLITIWLQSHSILFCFILLNHKLLRLFFYFILIYWTVLWLRIKEIRILYERLITMKIFKKNFYLSDTGSSSV